MVPVSIKLPEDTEGTFGLGHWKTGRKGKLYYGRIINNRYRRNNTVGNHPFATTIIISDIGKNHP